MPHILRVHIRWLPFPVERILMVLRDSTGRVIHAETRKPS